MNDTYNGKDIYATSMDYTSDATITRKFFRTVQNRLCFVIHGHTTATVIIERADSEKNHMGLTKWKNTPDGKILKGECE